MSDIKYERHLMTNPALPFIFHEDCVRKQQSGIANWHDNTEFLHCIEGEGIVNCDSNFIEMKKGDTIVINARCLHSISSATKVKYHCLIIDNSFFKDNGIDIKNITFTEKIHDAVTKEKLLNVADCIANKEDGLHIARTRLAVLDFIYHVTANFSGEIIGTRGKMSKSYAAVLDIIEYINKHFAENLTLEDISARAGFSRYHFTRIFKENTGVTVIDHIKARRCDNASYLLRETSKPISEISMECGFDSPSYFAKAFFASYGYLPSEYRKRYSKI